MDNRGKKGVLIVTAHPDDEVLGCGGTIAKHCQQNDDVHLMILTDGVTSRSYDPQRPVSREEELRLNCNSITKRHQETLKAAAKLGVSPGHLYQGGFADQRLDQYPLLDIIKKIEKIKEKIQPDVIYTHFWDDLNLDHQLTCQAVMTAFRPQSNGKKVSIYLFEVPESTYLSIPQGKEAFRPGHYVDITSTIPLKLEALKMYESEARVYPDLRSLQFMEELAKSRAQGKGFPYAEAFMELGH